MGFLPAISAALASIGVGAGAAGAAAGGASAAIGGTASGLASTIGAASALAGTATTLATALRGAPKPPTPSLPPVAPTFASGLSSGTNQSLSAQSPFAALGGTNTGVFGSSNTTGAKTLLGS